MLKEIGTQSDTRSDWYVGVVIYAESKDITVVMQRYYYWTVRHCFLYLLISKPHIQIYVKCVIKPLFSLKKKKGISFKVQHNNRIT